MRLGENLMNDKSFRTCFVALLLLTALAMPGFAQNPEKQPGIEGKQPAVDVTGTWSGTLYPKNSNVTPFSITIVVSRDPHGQLKATSSLSHDCLNGAHLTVTLNGANLVLAGSDDEGDNITVRGTLDSSGTLLKSSYILNGSATGRCETDHGTGDLAKR